MKRLDPETHEAALNRLDMLQLSGRLKAFFLVGVFIVGILAVAVPARASFTLGDLTGTPPFHVNDFDPHVPGVIGYVWPGGGQCAYLGYENLASDNCAPGYQAPYPNGNPPGAPSNSWYQLEGDAYAPFGAVLTGSTGDLIFALNATAWSTAPCQASDGTSGGCTRFTKQPGWDAWIILIPPGFHVPSDPSQIVSTVTNNGVNIWVGQLSPYDRYGPGWTMVVIKIDNTINPSYQHQTIGFTPAGEWYYARINGVTAPSIAGRYFFKMMLNGEYQPTEFIPTENWPVLLVKGEVDPAIITGTLRYGGYNATLYQQPIGEAARIWAHMITRLDPYTGLQRPDLPTIDAQAYLNATANGHYEIEGLAPGIFDIYASAGGYPQSLCESNVTVLRGQSLHFDCYLQPGPVIHGNIFSKHEFGDEPWPENTYVKVELYNSPTITHIPNSQSNMVSWSPVPCVAGGQGEYSGDAGHAAGCGDPRDGSEIAFPWHEYSTVSGPAYNDPPSLFTGNENGYVDDVSESGFFGNTQLTSDPMGVGPPQHWYVLGGTTTPFHFEFGVKGEYGAPTDLDGMVPQVYATWVNGLTAGRYYVRAWIFRYVQSGLDGSTFQEYYFDVTPNEWAGDVTLPIDLRLSSWVNETVHYHINNSTLVDQPIDTGAGFLVGYLKDAAGTVYSYNLTALGYQGMYGYSGAGGYVLPTPFIDGENLDPARLNAQAVEDGVAVIQFWGINDTWGGENYGIPSGTYTPIVRSLGFLQENTLPSVSVTLSGNPTSISDHLYRGGGFNITLNSIDWEQPTVARPWVWGNDQGGAAGNGVGRGSEIDLGFFYNGGLVSFLSDEIGDLPVTITTSGMFQGVAGNPCPNQSTLPVLSRSCTVADGGGRNIRPSGSENANYAYFGYEDTDPWVGGATGGNFVFLQTGASLWPYFGILPYAFQPGRYDLRAFTYGYIQTGDPNVFVQAGSVADISINLVVGVNVSLDILFKKEQIITGTPSNMSARVRLYNQAGYLVATWMSSEGVYVTGNGLARAADGTTAFPFTARYFQTVPGSGLQAYNFVPGGTTLLHVLLAGLPQQPPISGYYGDPIFTPYSCGFAITCFGSYGRWQPIGQTTSPFAEIGIAGAPDYEGGWTAEVDFVNWYPNNTGAEPAYYPPVLGLLMGESFHMIAGTTASSGVSLTDDSALQLLRHSMIPNHLGPYSQEGVWQIAGAHNSGEASAIFEVDLNGFVSGSVVGFTYAGDFRTQSWAAIGVTAVPYQTNHTPKSVESVNGASIDTSQSPPFGMGAGKFVAANKEYLSIPNSTDFNFGSNDFTIDFWVKFDSLPTNGVMGILSQFVDSNNYMYFGLYGSSGTSYWFWQTCVGGTTTSNGVLATTVSTGVWYHIAYVRDGANLLVFQNGSLLGTITTISGSMPSLSAPLSIGVAWALPNFDGWLKEFRISNGVARWTSNFTPPTSEYTPDQYSVLLLHMDGANGSTVFADSNSGPVTVTPALSVGRFYTYDGVYQAFLPTGNYQFTIAQPGYVPQTWSVSISPGETGTGQNIYLEQSNIPVPEFSTSTVVAFSALAASVYLLKRRHK